MKISALALLFCFLFSCSVEPSFKKDFYEKVSEMKFPKKIKVVESVDNGEWLTVTSLKVDSLQLIDFVKKYKFKKATKESRLYLSFGTPYLKKAIPDYKVLDNFYEGGGDRGRNHWWYVADIKKNLLWAQVAYPDWSGN